MLRENKLNRTFYAVANPVAAINKIWEGF